MINFEILGIFNQAYRTHHGSQAYLINHGEIAHRRANLSPDLKQLHRYYEMIDNEQGTVS